MPIEIDREILAARRLQAAAVAPFDMSGLPPDQARALANRAAMVFADGKPELHRVEDFAVPGPGGTIRARLYQAAGATTEGSVLYIHGGGWFACDVDTHDRMLRFLAMVSRVGVLAFDFRLSPEHPYPAALDDTRAVWRWLHGAGAEHRLPTGRVAVAGDSAGANLGLALALAERDHGVARPAGLALLYGCFAPGLMTPSRARFGDGSFGLTGERMDWYWANYLGAAAAAPPVLAAPLRASLAGLPPVYLGVAQCDVVADESKMLAERLGAAGVPVTVDEWPHATHGLLQMTRDVQLARDAVTSVARALRSFLCVPRAMPTRTG